MTPFAKLNTRAKGTLIMLFGIFFIIPDSLFIRLIDADSLVIAFWRCMLIGSVIFVGLLAYYRGSLWHHTKAIGIEGVVFAIATGTSALFFVVAIGNTDVANVVFILTTIPIFAAVFSAVLLREWPTRRTTITIGFVIVGIGIIASDSLTTGSGNMFGDLMALLTAALFAMAITMIRAKKDVSMLPALPFAHFGCALVLVFFVDVMSVPTHQWGLVWLHGGVFITLGTLGLSLAPRYLPSAEVGLFVLLEAVLAPILVWFWIGEEPTRNTVLGGVLVLVVLFVSNVIALIRANKRQKKMVAKIAQRRAQRATDSRNKP